MIDKFKIAEAEVARRLHAYDALTARVAMLEAQQDWIYESLIELNTSNYTYDDVCAANPKTVLALLDRIAELEEVEKSRTSMIDYSVDLQRIIEDLCCRREIRKPQTTARHHYDMAVSFRDALVSWVKP